METFDWPAKIAPWRVAFYLQPHTGGSESPITRTRKTYGLSAPRWVARLTFRGGDGAGTGEGSWGRRMDAMVADLDGGLNLIRFWDFRRPRRSGQPLGRPLTNAAALAGATVMEIAGFPPYGYAYGQGEYIGGDGRPHLVRADVWADAVGVATVAFRPPLARDVAMGAAIYEEVTGAFQLVGDDAGQNESEVGELTPHVLDFVEYLP